ncbi:hypothetical protein AB0C38_10030 [Amycolatopsis sp. NPDC048633]|uniref:hypothetical protein n=1 Tax=Amycolatopsis sp. NPDC048633 TaxID=3157095 RepID=UPI0033E372F9
MNGISCGLTAGISLFLSYLEVDKSFFVPKLRRRRVKMQVFAWFFAAVNGIFSIGVLYFLTTFTEVGEWGAVLAALIAGLGYASLARQKFTTLKINEQEFPVGFEMLYDHFQRAMYRRINVEAKRARRVEARALVKNNTLAELVQEAIYTIETDYMYSEEQKRECRSWVADTVDLAEAADWQKCFALALFVVSGDKSEVGILPAQYRSDVAV